MAELNLNLTVDNNIQANFYIEGTGSGGGGTPGGLANTLQFNDAGALGGIANVTYSNGNLSLGPVANVKMTGGQANYFLQTDGNGNLSFKNATTVLAYSTIPRMEFTALTTGINQTFTNANIARYSSNAVCTVFRNGVLIDPTEYVVSGSTITFSNVLNINEVIDIPASASLGIGTDVGGNSGEIQYNHNNTLAASDKMKFDSVTGRMTITGDIVPGVSNVYNLGNTTHRWKDVFLSNNSVVIGDTTLSSDGGLKIDGDTALVAVNDTLTIGNIEIGNVGNIGNLIAANANIANLEITGNANVGNLVATGNIEGNILTVGNVGELLSVDANGIMVSSDRYYIGGNGTGGLNISRDSSTSLATLATYSYGNTAVGSTSLVARARGTKETPVAVQIGDRILGISGIAYTGNGTGTLDGIPGWSIPISAPTGIAVDITSLSTSPTTTVGTSTKLIASNSVANTSVFATLSESGNFTISGTFIGNVKAAGTIANIAELQFGNANGVMVSSNRHYIGANGVGGINVSRDAAGAGFAYSSYNNTMNAQAVVAYKARGTKAAPAPSQVLDGLQLTSSFFYTGNGTLTNEGIAGWREGAFIRSEISALPVAANGCYSTDLYFMTTDATANTYREAAIIKADRSITLKGNLVAANTNPPATATSTGVQGQIAFDSQYVYYCHATDTWVRSPMATW